MELTKQQTQKIEYFLNNNNITYIDIRLEAFDHIVTDIETRIESQNIDFETAFTSVTKIWKMHFNDSSSLYFGLYYAAPKMVIDKAKKSFKKFYFLYLAAYFLPLIGVQYLKIPVFIDFMNVIFPALQIVGVCCTFFFIFLLIKKWLSKEKTTYSFILKTQTASIAFGLLVTFHFFYADNNLANNAIWIAFNFAFLISTYIYYHFYKKHIETIKKHKIS